MNNKKKNPIIPNKIAVASWLISNTKLTFEQIADFCSMHKAEVSSISRRDTINGVFPFNPVPSYTTEDLISESEESGSPLLFSDKYMKIYQISSKVKVKPYSSKAQKRNRLDAALWMVSFYPLVIDTAIARLVRSTKSTVGKIRARTYKDMSSLESKSPVTAGLCSQGEFDKVLSKYGY